MSSGILLRGGCVLTLGSRTPNLPVGDVLIRDGRVAEVGPSIRARDVEVVDATDTIVMPGFVDAHRHSWRSLFRNSGRRAGWHDLLTHHGPDEIHAATLIGLLGAVEAGITTVVDWADVPAGECEDALRQAHEDAGLRTVLVRADPSPGPHTGDRSTVAWGAGAGATEETWQVARQSGARIHAHVRGSGGVARLGGRLGPDVTLVHLSEASAADLDRVRSSGAAVVSTPSTEMVDGTPPPIQDLIDRGLRPGLGVDDEGTAPGDLFAQMRAVISLQHALLFELRLAGKGGVPSLLNTRDTIRYATIDGARAIGLDAVTGSIEPGKRADIVVLRTDRPNIHPINDPIGAVVWGMDTSNIDWVLVDGRVLVRDGASAADTTDARRRASEARDRVLASAGVASGREAAS